MNSWEIHLLHYKVIGAPNKFKKWPLPLLRPRTNHTRLQKPNRSRETVPLWDGRFYIEILTAQKQLKKKKKKKKKKNLGHRVSLSVLPYHIRSNPPDTPPCPREYLMYCRGPGFLAIGWLGSFFHPLSRHQVVSLSLSSCVCRPSSLLIRGTGGGRCQIIRRRESLTLRRHSITWRRLKPPWALPSAGWFF